MSSPFHRGELEAQALAGGGPRGHGIQAFLTDQHRDFFEQLPWVVAAAAQGTQPLLTVLSGEPGFLAAPDDRTLCLRSPAEPADPAQRALVPGAPVALLGLDFRTRRRNRANGKVLARDAAGLRIGVQQAFGNCPKYIRPREAHLVGPRVFGALSAVDDRARALVTRADTFFVATGAPPEERAGGLDVSHRGGEPGFVRWDGDALVIPDYAGNRYFNTLGNLVLQPQVALLFIDFEDGSLLHLQGRAAIVWTVEREAAAVQRLWRVQVEGARRAAPIAS